ncbi:MAG: glutaredoxin [Clostridia bacterium]|nr:glutaredoxin [Oscillospiraceae bacterium]MBP5726607.1 glutaredoxin [Clostridia bacterium]
MKAITMFYLETCGYCDKARRALEELYAENPVYKQVPLTMIEESREPALADTYDYYAVPSFFDGKTKLFEAHLFMSYEDIRDEVKKVLDYAMV